jgi:hypothetical protein
MDHTIKVAAAPTQGFALHAATLAPDLASASAVAFVASRLTVWETAHAQAWFGRPVATAAPVIALVIGVAFHAAAAPPSIAPFPPRVRPSRRRPVEPKHSTPAST